MSLPDAVLQSRLVELVLMCFDYKAGHTFEPWLMLFHVHMLRTLFPKVDKSNKPDFQTKKLVLKNR